MWPPWPPPSPRSPPTPPASTASAATWAAAWPPARGASWPATTARRRTPSTPARGGARARRWAAGRGSPGAAKGGSAAPPQPPPAELVGRYRHERAPLAAIALHADTSTVTALVNDYPPDDVFARQVEAFG